MPAQGDSYSRFIALSKIALPLAALGVLATLFLLSRISAPGSDGLTILPQAEVTRLLKEQRLTAPTYAGVTRDGTQIALAAESARRDPDTPGRTIADVVTVSLDLADGTKAGITADHGTMDRDAGQLVLEGDTTVTTSTGYRIQSQQVITSLDDTEVIAPGQVTAEGPPGRLEAGSMRLATRPGDPDNYLLVFKDGVKLVYDPQR